MRQLLDLCRDFDAVERTELAAKMRLRDRIAGQTVMRQGDIGERLYVHAKRILDVRLDRDELDPLQDRIAPGEMFGENSLLTGQQRWRDRHCRAERRDLSILPRGWV